LMDDAQIGSKAVILLCFRQVAKHLMGFPQVQIQRGIKVVDPFISHRFSMTQRNLIPMQSLFRRILKTRYIMCCDAGFIIVGMRIPGLLVKRASILESVFEFGACACHAKLDDGVGCVHFLNNIA